MGRPNLLAKIMFLAPMIAVGSVCQAEADSIHMETHGNCASNYAQTSSYTQMPEFSASSKDNAGAKVTVHRLADPARNCFIINLSHDRLNPLEYAQLQVTQWEHRLRVTVGQPTLANRLGEVGVSLWADIDNDSPYDASEVRSVNFGAPKPHGKSPVRPQVYRKLSDPELVFGDEKGAPLPATTHIVLQLADPNELRKALDNVPNDYCLYDVSTRAQDENIEGYARVSFVNVGDRVEYHYKSIPVAYSVSMKDMFGVSSSMQIPAFLRFAPRSTTSIFYPSTTRYDAFRCLPL